MLNALKRLPLVERLRGALRHDVEQTVKPLRNEVRRLSRQVEQLEAALQATAERAARSERDAARARWTLQLDAAQRPRLAALPDLLDEARIAAHVRQAIAAAPIVSTPLDHILVERLLPDDLYALLLEAIPPAAFFTQNDPIKQDLTFPMEVAPAFHSRVWNFLDQVIAQRVIRPAVMQKFHDRLQDHYDAIFGPEFRARANALPHSTSGGRLMLRRPGYHLSAHRDPKRSLITCLMYLARPGDDEAHGTQLYDVAGDGEAHYKQTYYPERDGHPCTLVRTVPFRPNSMLVFLNARGAHGADIPKDAPAALERYSYQFYIAPDNEALSALVKSLPAERKFMWKNRNRVVWDEGGTPRRADSRP